MPDNGRMDWARAVRAAFERADYTVAGVRELLGPVAGGALAREQIVPALRACRGTELGALVRLFWLQVPIEAAEVSGVEALIGCGLAERSGSQLRALLHVEPLEAAGEHRGWVVSDLKPRLSTAGMRRDFVVGAGGASAALGKLAVARPAPTALDLGTGSGVQALYLADRVDTLCATDVNPRALRLARMTFALSGLADVETAAGSLFEPVAGRRFDLIVSNPPFVVAPPDKLFSYRESGLDGDEVCRRLVRSAPGHLVDGGWCQLLGNWLHVAGEPWQDRLESWVRDLGCDVWVAQRDVQDPAEYAELWLRDSAEVGTPEYRARYESWLDYFAERKVVGIGFGWISLRRGGGAVRVEELGHAVAEPVGGYVARVLDGLSAAAHVDLPHALLRTADGVLEERVADPGAEDPMRIVLRQTHGLRRAADIGTVAAALAGVCDGTLRLDPLIAALAELLGEPVAEVRAQAEAALPGLIADGFFEVANRAEQGPASGRG
jgi:methylase of polypeptide subunit release factors